MIKLRKRKKSRDAKSIKLNAEQIATKLCIICNFETGATVEGKPYDPIEKSDFMHLSKILTESGTIDGIAGNVDLNIAYKNYPEIIKNKGLNGFSKLLETSNYTAYTVKSGDSLWGIAKKLLGDGSKYTKIKKFNNLSSNIIYPNQILKIPKDVF